jgi:hypothetical protein
MMVAAAASALSGIAGERLYAQGADPNAAPNPYKMQENWAQLPEGRKFGAAKNSFCWVRRHQPCRQASPWPGRN